MKGNYGFLIAAGASVLSVVAVSLGAHIYRWQVIAWSAVAGVYALLAYAYSRRRP